MKHLKEYFSSPTTTLQVNNSDELIKSVENADLTENVLNIEELDKNVDQIKRKRKRKKKRKVSDPLVRDVTELLSTNLKLVSPSKTESKNVQLERVIREVPPIDLIVDFSESVIEGSNELPPIPMKENTPENNGSITKRDAFQFMMERRNRSIGLNSPGKELDKASNTNNMDNIDNKAKLASRRDIFSNWSNKKGAIKRKRFEEEKDEIIEHKLNKRARRLKNLLNVEEEKKSFSLKFAKSRIRKLSSSSEDSDFKNDERDEVIESNRNKKDLTKKQNIELDEKNTNSIKTVKKAKNQYKELKNNQTPIKYNKGNILSFIKSETLNSIEIEESDSVKDKPKTELNIQTKHKNNKISENKNIKENSYSNMEDTFPKEKLKKKKKKTKRLETLNNTEIEESDLEKNKAKTESISNKSYKINTINKTELNIQTKHKGNKISENKNIKENSHSNVEDTFPKDKLKKKKKKTKEPIDVLDELSQDSVNLTSRMLRSWKMKIKVNMDDNRDVRTKNKINYAEDCISNDSQENKIEIELSSESEEDNDKKTEKRFVKMAPVFTKAVPKPREDPSVIEARKQFLLSGIPTSLKKTIEKQNSFAEHLDVFPTTQHIQQKSDNHFWNLTEPELNMTTFSPLKVSYNDLNCQKITKCHIIRNINIDKEVKKVDKLKILLNKIKSENPYYPVYKSFKQIHTKSGHKLEDESETKNPEKRKRGRKKKKNTEKDLKPLNKIESESVIYTMWTEKYKPKCCDDIIGNSQAIRNLKKWLDGWKNFNQEINSRKRRLSNSSGSEFENTDCDSKDSTRLPGKIIVLAGPCGSGKSSAVYAICKELGFNVIEINASSKRTGKRLLQEIQEATQSHQVQSDSQTFQNFLSNSLRDKSKSSEQQTDQKMCVILIEDVDIVFEQDDGFISALIQLTTTSKRPIIATTTDYNSIFVQKYLNQYEYIQFLPLSSYSLSTWLQIVCLCEGLYISQNDIGSLLEYNKGDIRKTLLQFQFWVQSGGQIVQNVMPIKIEYTPRNCEEKLEADEENELIEDDKLDYTFFEHKHCFRSFEILELEESFKVPFYLKMGLLWWNIPNILSIPDYSRQRIDKLKGNATEIKSLDISKKANKEKLHLINKVYDSLIYADVTFKMIKYYDGVEPLVRKGVKLGDSLELREITENKNNDLEFVHDLTHFLVNGSIKNYTKTYEDCRLNVTLPNKSEKRWRIRLQEYENVYRDAIPVSNEKNSTALDYMPVLRDITRSECSRAANNTKRGNRFRNYLRELGIHCNEITNTVACNVLS